MKKSIAALAFCALSGCASTPTGVETINQLRNLENATEAGQFQWSYFYPRAISTISSLEPAEWLSILKEHYVEMRPYADALSEGKITQAEFNLLRERSLKTYQPRFQAAQKSVPMLIGERQRAAQQSDMAAAVGIIGGALLGASLARTAPLPAPIVNCTSSQMGRYVNTTCY